MLQLAPPETRNMRIMEINYQDTTKPYDSWFWMPSIRRVRRRSTSERQDAQGGADYCAYDNMGWDGAVSYQHLQIPRTAGNADGPSHRHEKAGAQSGQVPF